MTGTDGLITDYPLVRVSGTGYDRGVQYGKLASERVHRSLRFYARVFQEALNVDWRWVKERAASFARPIADFSEDIAGEMRGIAAGAGVDFEDILCINCRTEVLHSATLHATTGRRGRFLSECSAFAVEAASTACGSLIVGQNWDFLSGCHEHVVLLSVEQNDKPNYITLVEAGLVGKLGMNGAGVALTTNFLVTERDLGDDGLPFHIVLRALLESQTVTEGLATLQGMTRSGSGNYTLASACGLSVNVETAPGGYRDTAVMTPEDGLLAHTNHFLCDRFLCRPSDEFAVAMRASTSSVTRLLRLKTLLREHRGQIDRNRMQAILADHADHPCGLCTHGDLTQPAYDREVTCASIIMEPSTRGMWLAAGNPCVAPFRKVDTSILGG